MILIATLSLLNVIISRAAARSMPILTRQANTTTGGNTFASITPSETLAWFPCYEDSLARQLGPISCARLIVRRNSCYQNDPLKARGLATCSGLR